MTLALSDTALADLGAGRPSRDTVALLRRAQTGKHLLLLSDLLRHSDEQTRHFWYEREHADPTGFREQVTDPMFGLRMAAQARRTPIEDTSRPHKSQATGSPHESQTTGSPHESQATGRWLVAEHRGQEFRIRLEDRDPARSLLGLEPTGPLDAAAVAHWQRCLDDAWRILVDRHAEAATTLAGVVTCLVPVSPDPAARGISATSVNAFGAVAMSAPGDGLALAVGLLHEAQHSLLNATLHLFDLLEQPRTPAYSPWRDDPRPDSGVLHGAYAYLAVTRFWRAEAAATGDRLAAFEFARWREATAAAADHLLSVPLTAAGRRFVGALRDEVGGWLDDPVEPTVVRLARLANRDHHLRWRLRNLAVPPDVTARLVEAWRANPRDASEINEGTLITNPRRALENSPRLNLIHTTLKTINPHKKGKVNQANGQHGHDGERGRGHGHDGERGHGHDGERGRGHGHDGERRHGHGGHDGHDGERGADVAPGDDALVRGDYESARTAYAQKVLEDPDDDAAWAGLALTTPRKDRVELAKALVLAAGVEPQAALEWIG